VLVGQFGDAHRQRRGEQHVETLIGFGHAPQQKTDVVDETQIEHAVGLVEHHDLDGLEIEHMLFEVIDDAARRADQNVHALFQLLALTVIPGAAIDQAQTQPGVRHQQQCVLVDLNGQFAGRRQYQGARLRLDATTARRVAQQMIHGREQEGGGLAGAGLCLTSDVASVQGQRQALRLNRRAA